MTEVQMDSIVFHGPRTTYYKDNYHKTEHYQNGSLIITHFYNPDGKEVSVHKFEKSHLSTGQCGKIMGHYFLHGKK